jgi:sugar phosphate isomerase/epimerase
MEKTNKSNKVLSRRKFLGGTAAAAAMSVVPFNFANGPVILNSFSEAKPNSKFGGVQIGAITYSWRDLPGGVDNIIKYCTEAGISSIELMSPDLESYLGAPENPRAGMMRPPAGQMPGGQPGGNPPAQGQGNQQPQGNRPEGAPAQAQPGGFQRPRLTPEQEAQIAKYNDDLRAWRLSVPMSKFADAKKKFNDAGIDIHIVKFSPSRWSDEEIDYAFKAAKAMGAKGVTDELGEEAVKKLAPFAEKNGMYAIFHQHMQFATPGFSYDPFLAVSPAVMMNFDAGHFFGSTGIHPNTILEKYHDRIVSVHIKDKTGPKTDPANTNQVWGQGEMPLEDVLLLIKKKKWPLFCDIELEYPVKPWSTSVKEVRTCVHYARQILM